MKKTYGTLSVFCCLFLLLCGCQKSSYLDLLEEGTSVAEEDFNEQMPDDNKSGESKTCFVQISGAVKVPGVYELPQNARVFEVIEKAGGLLENAWDFELNQAQTVEDGQKIYVYTKEEYDAMKADSHVENADYAGKMNLNVASKEELMSLPGIGASKAEAIVAYRDKNGAFQSTEDLMQIPGIKEGVFTKIKDQIYVN